MLFGVFGKDDDEIEDVFLGIFGFFFGILLGRSIWNVGRGGFFGMFFWLGRMTIIRLTSVFREVGGLCSYIDLTVGVSFFCWTVSKKKRLKTRGVPISTSDASPYFPMGQAAASCKALLQVCDVNGEDSAQRTQVTRRWSWDDAETFEWTGMVECWRRVTGRMLDVIVGWFLAAFL